VGGERVEVPRHVGAALGREPVARGLRVGHRLQRGEGLGGDEEQRALGTQRAQQAAQLHAVHVGDEVQALGRVAQVVERLHRHRGPEVGAADADVHDVGDGVVLAHLLGDAQHGVQRGVHVAQALRYYIRSCLRLPCLRWSRFSQQPVHHRALLGVVDGRAREHGVAVGRQAALARQLHQQRLGGRVDAVLGQVREHVGRLLAEALHSLRVFGEGIAHVEVPACALVVRAQLAPGIRAVAARARVRVAHAAACISCSSLAASAAKARMPSASFSVAMASALSA
jgi:hypothetical protein